MRSVPRRPVAAQNLGYGGSLGNLGGWKAGGYDLAPGRPTHRALGWNRIHFVLKDGVRYDGLSWN